MYTHMMDRKIGYLVMVVACLSLLPSSAGCQPLKQQPCLKLKEKIYSFDAVRQSDFYDVALRFEARECVLNVTAEFTPLEASWRAEPNSALQADEQSSVGRPLPGDGAHSRELTITIRVTASAEAEAGKHIIKGVLRYQAIEPSGNREEQLSLEIPVKVVPAGATVHARKVQADGDLKWYQILIVIVLFPIAFLIYGANEC